MSPKTRLTPLAKKRLVLDYEKVCATLSRFRTGLREPEIAAASGLCEDRVYRAVKWASRLGYLQVDAIGEVSIAPPQLAELESALTKLETR